MVGAPILIPTDSLVLPDAKKAEVRAHWASWWRPLRDEVRRQPPAEGSPAEIAAMRRLLDGLSSTFSEFGSVIMPLLRSSFDRLLQDLVAAEDAKAPTEKRLGLKFLSRAVQVLDTFFESFRAFGPELDSNAFSYAPQTDEEFGRAFDNASLALLRLELAVFIAFDLAEEESGASTEEFVEWARRAQNASNHAQPYVAVIASQRLAGSAVDPLSADLVLSNAGFEQIAKSVEQPRPPSDRLRGLLRGRDS